MIVSKQDVNYMWNYKEALTTVRVGSLMLHPDWARRVNLKAFVGN